MQDVPNPTKVRRDSIAALRKAWPHRHTLRGRIVVTANVAMLRRLRPVTPERRERELLTILDREREAGRAYSPIAEAALLERDRLRAGFAS